MSEVNIGVCCHDCLHCKSTGNVRVGGEDIEPSYKCAKGNRMGYYFNNPDAICPDASYEEEVY